MVPNAKPGHELLAYLIYWNGYNCGDVFKKVIVGYSYLELSYLCQYTCI